MAVTAFSGSGPPMYEDFAAKGDCTGAAHWAALGVPEADVRMITHDVGGNFGTRGAFNPEFALVVWAARRVGRAEVPASLRLTDVTLQRADVVAGIDIGQVRGRREDEREAVPVHQGQRVNKGDVLLKLDPTPFQIAVDGAKANLGGIVSSLNALKLDYKRMLADVEVKQSQVASDQVNFDRYAGLVKSGGVTRAVYDNARYLLATDRQSVEALKVVADVQLARLGGDPEVDVRTMADYRQAKARLDEAQRELDHAVIYAPFAGVVTQVDTVQPGMYLAIGTAAFGLVSTIGPAD